MAAGGAVRGVSAGGDCVGVPSGGGAGGLAAELLGEAVEGFVEVELFSGVGGVFVEVLAPVGDGGDPLELVVVLPPVLLE